MSMTMVGRRGSPAPTAACIAATESLAQCASACLASPGAPEVTSCAEWCVAGARTLGACADVIELGGAERAPLVLALARAGVEAADACAAACAALSCTSEHCADAAAACQEAARQLRQLIAELGPETTGHGRAPALLHDDVVNGAAEVAP